MSDQPSATELLGHHLDYEINQLNAALHMLGRVKVPADWKPQSDWQKLLNNSLMESFYLHARILFEFFEKKKGAKLYADTTFKSYSQSEIKRWVRPLNNQAAHLLEGRTNDDTKKLTDADRVEMANELSDKLERFKKALKPDYRGLVTASITKLLITSSGPQATNSPTAIK
ncbi:hypothetical protein [Tardiphaga robiniae]|uniref:HEPN AbiU2-like domain-containing protein n=1 Tax=Tardiphaga robiniae TaxID=943830 RepID=A0A7G6TWY5_9BRAD|nr:hypothetical protein [Tardiphaga robiniae]QND71267.1 hypothetical protein HB776_08470 [Tardiphaga robiniae]